MTESTPRRAPYRVLAAAACAAILAHASALATSVSPNAWLTLTDRTRWSLGPDAVIFATVWVILSAPVLGVAATTVRRTTDTNRGVASSVFMFSAAISMFTLVSAVLTIGWRYGQGDALAYTARAHATLAAVAMALAAWGALCGVWFRNALDAAGISLVITLIAACGLLLGGTVSADLPRSLVAMGLVASPLFATASAAQIDLLHSDLLYQISPLAHVQIDYPTWTVATASYVAAAGICLLTLTAQNRRIAVSLHN